MNKFVLSLFTSLLLVTASFAQTPQELVKKATKAIENIGGKKEKVAEAQTAVDDALKLSEAATNFDIQLLKAKLNNEISEIDNLEAQKMVLLNKPYTREFTMSALNAYTSFQAAQKVLPTDPKLAKKSLSELFKAASKTQTTLGNYAQDFIDKKDYASAYASFKGALDLHKFLKDNGQKSALDDAKVYDRQEYLSVLLSGYAGKEKENADIYQKRITAGKDTIFDYTNLYKVKLDEGKTDEALQILAAGRKKFPNDSQMLFTEINYYLKVGKLDILIDKLKEGIVKEPKNPSLYFTLGNVYDNLGQKEPDSTKKADLEANAVQWYDKTLEVDPKYSDAAYSKGAIFYNKAAKISQDMKALESDFSKAGQKKYEALEKSMLVVFDKSLPYFQKAESINPNDLNTLIALKEIYAKKNDLNLSKEFKSRVDTVQSGGKNTAYFKQ